MSEPVCASYTDVAEVRAHAAQLHAVDQLFGMNAHHVHAHGAGHQMHARRLGFFDEHFQRVHVLLLHDHLHHPGAHARHVHAR